MDVEQYIEDNSMQINSYAEDKPSLENWKTVLDAMADTNRDPSGFFDCNICLETVKDPVVTLCGHLFCWPCIYKWLHFKNISIEKQEKQVQQCPVCKAEVSDTTLVPLYGKGETQDSFESKTSQQGLVIPRRPHGPAYWFETSRPITFTTPQFQHGISSVQSNIYHARNDGTTQNRMNPMIGVFGETVYARMFGGTITNLYAYPNSYPLVWSSSPRIRRHILQTDESLNRICLFLFCCSILCLLLF